LVLGFVHEAKQTPKNAVAIISVFLITIFVVIKIYTKVGWCFMSK
jgi:hypothetical protein